jgi:hypothetical protein
MIVWMVLVTACIVLLTVHAVGLRRRVAELESKIIELGIMFDRRQLAAEAKARRVSQLISEAAGQGPRDLTPPAKRSERTVP